MLSVLNDPRQKATFLAATAPGDWLNALPIASCGLRLDDETVRVVVALRLELDDCIPHSCSCGENVDAFVCKHASSRMQRHHALNDARSFASAGIPVSKEIFDSVKRPDGITLVPWQSGRALNWDAYLPASCVTAAAAASGEATVCLSVPEVVSHCAAIQCS